jgi:hypothetical protein
MKKNKDKLDLYREKAFETANKMIKILGDENNNDTASLFAFAILIRSLCDQYKSEKPFQVFLTLFHGLKEVVIEEKKE